MMIKDIDEYLGYIAWSTIFKFVPEKRNMLSEVLVELVLKFPEYPEAYFALWHYINKFKKNDFQCLEISERLFLNNSSNS